METPDTSAPFEDYSSLWGHSTPKGPLGALGFFGSATERAPIYTMTNDSLIFIQASLPAAPSVALLRALWSPLDGIWGAFKGSFGGVLIGLKFATYCFELLGLFGVDIWKVSV